MKYKTYTLQEIATFTTGKLNSNEAERNGKYPFFTTAPQTLRINKYAFDQDAVLLGGNNANGIFQLKRYTGKFNAYQRTYVISSKKTEIINNDYLYYALMPKLAELQNRAIGTATKYITKSILNNIQIKVPASKEKMFQHGERLKIIDRKIELNNRLNDNLFALSKVIFDHILGNKTIKFSQISTIQNGYAFKSKEYITDKQLMILRTKNINDNHLFSKNDVIYISNNLFSNYKKFLFNTFDTVLVMVGASIGKTGFITSNMMPALQNQNMWRFRPLISGMPGLLVYQYVNYINEHVKGSATGSARSFYRKKVFNDFNVPYIEHKNYAIFIALQKEINRINVENDILRNIKKSLLNYFF